GAGRHAARHERPRDHPTAPRRPGYGRPAGAADVGQGAALGGPGGPLQRRVRVSGEAVCPAGACPGGDTPAGRAGRDLAASDTGGGTLVGRVAAAYKDVWGESPQATRPHKQGDDSMRDLIEGNPELRFSDEQTTELIEHANLPGHHAEGTHTA